jgi:hypothetical protein
VNDSIAEATSKLAATVWKTHGARLCAHRRLGLMHQASLWTMSIASTYVIALSVAGLVLQGEGVWQSWLPVISIVSATGILALSLVEAAQRYEVRAERLHDCALDLGLLGGRIDDALAAGQASVTRLGQFRHQYNSILVRHKENHATLDYTYYRATQKELDHDLPWRVAMVARWYVAILWRSALVIVLPLVAAAWLAARAT